VSFIILTIRYLNRISLKGLQWLKKMSLITVLEILISHFISHVSNILNYLKISAHDLSEGLSKIVKSRSIKKCFTNLEIIILVFDYYWKRKNLDPETKCQLFI